MTISVVLFRAHIFISSYLTHISPIPGDEVLSLNGESMQGLLHSEAVTLFKSVRSGAVTLEVARRDPAAAGRPSIARSVRVGSGQQRSVGVQAGLQRSIEDRSDTQRSIEVRVSLGKGELGMQNVAAWNL